MKKSPSSKGQEKERERFLFSYSVSLSLISFSLVEKKERRRSKPKVSSSSRQVLGLLVGRGGGSQGTPRGEGRNSSSVTCQAWSLGHLVALQKKKKKRKERKKNFRQFRFEPEPKRSKKEGPQYPSISIDTKRHTRHRYQT